MTITAPAPRDRSRSLTICARTPRPTRRRQDAAVGAHKLRAMPTTDWAHMARRDRLQLCSPCLVTTPPSPSLASLSAASPSLAPTWRSPRSPLSPREAGGGQATVHTSLLPTSPGSSGRSSAHLGQSRGRSSSSLARDTTEIQPRYNLEEGEARVSRPRRPLTVYPRLYLGCISAPLSSSRLLSAPLDSSRLLSAPLGSSRRTSSASSPPLFLGCTACPRQCGLIRRSPHTARPSPLL